MSRGAGNRERGTRSATARLVADFEDCSLASLSHEDHVRVTWHYLQSASLARVLAELPGKLARYATSKGAPEHYHETITFAFTCLIHDRIARSPQQDWDQFRQANSDLFDSKLLQRYYPPDLLGTPLARERFLFPSAAFSVSE